MAIIESAGIKADTVLIDRLGAHLADTDAEECEKLDATLLMVGTHGRRGVGRMLTGSGTEQIIRVASCPVLVVRGTQEI